MKTDEFSTKAKTKHFYPELCSRGLLSALWAIAFICLGPGILLLSANVAAHGVHHKATTFPDDPRGLRTLNWHRPGISRVVTAGYPDSFGLFAFNGRQPSEVLNIEGKTCLKANFLAFDVDDVQAFNTPKNTQLRIRIQIATQQSGSLIMGYDGHGVINPYQIIDEKHLLGKSQNTDSKLSWFEVSLPDVRLHNRGMAATDLALTTLETMKYPSDILPTDITGLVLCDVQIADLPIKDFKKSQSGSKNENKSVLDSPSANQLTLTFLSESGSSTPIRFGLYDKHGSQMMVSEGALAVPYYEDEVRVLSLRDGLNPEQFWPHQNRYYQYTDGAVRFELVPGEYQLIASKGPEYKLILQTIQVTHEAESSHNIQLQRFVNWQEKGWYSGDVHVHMNRKSDDAHSLLAIAQAEDLHVTNLLTMSNIDEDHYSQPIFGKPGRATKRVGGGFHSLVAGVEAPRTAFRGHGLSLNIKGLLKTKADKKHPGYFLYHKYFSEYRQQGGVNGYAHIGSEEFNGSWGLALDVPFGLVDFAEIMQNSRLRTQIWYEHLNIGHRIAPAAGSDFPYFDQPGAVRSYASVTDQKTDKTDSWFSGLKAGKVFVSNGPLVHFSLDKQLPGGEVPLKSSYNMDLEVALNPELDHIKTVEIIHCGKIVDSLTHLTHKIDAGRLKLTKPISLASFDGEASGWVAVKVTGQDQALAHTGAIYIKDSDGQSICPDQYQTTLKVMLTRLELFAASVPSVSRELEYWESQALLSQYQQQSQQLQQRIQLAKQYYLDKLHHPKEQTLQPQEQTLHTKEKGHEKFYPQ